MQRSPTNMFFSYALIFTLAGSLFSFVLPISLPSYASHENITMNVSDEVTDTYEPGDAVAVEGVIADVVANEDVTIRFKDPNGSIEDFVDFGEPGSNDNFDAVFDIPLSADEGVWTVEVDYDNEKAYTYFIVDDVEDTITVELAQTNRIYEAGDDVTISGRVDSQDIGTDAHIIVLDPANDEIVDEDQVQLGEGPLSNDEFEYEFSLDNDASHGRYAVIVTYDIDNQEGSVLFEIEDQGTGGGSQDVVETVTSATDGDLSAEIDEDTYDLGAMVTITGTIENYDDTELLSISINDPDDLEIEEDDDVSVEADGNDGLFEFEYELNSNAEEGGYTIIIAYDTDDVELVFEVKEGAGGGVGTEDVTVKLIKSSYLAGETMTVSGTVADLQEDDQGEPELVSILLYRPNGLVILQASKYVEPSSSGAYSADIFLDSELEIDEGYKIIVGYAGDSAETLFDITGVSTTPSDKVTVKTDKTEYSVGSTVEISGKVPAMLIVSGQQLLIRVNAPDGNPCRIDPIDLPAGGSYTYELVLGGTCGMAGEYDVEVTYGENESSTEFELVGSSFSSYSLNVEGDAYPIKYELTDGSIRGMFVRPTEDKLVITLSAENDGRLTVELSRNVIDAIEDGQDIDYVVTIEDESGNVVIADVEESENTDNARTLVIDYPAGSERIEIAGTQVIPEFGAITAIIMAIAIVGIIVATAKYNARSLLRK